MGTLINEIGNRHGRLIVIERAGSDPSRRALWQCRCDCGNETIVLGRFLRNGTTRSCGCLRKERVREVHTLPRGEAAFNELFRHIKRQAERRGYIFNLTREQVKYLTSQPCYYCGAEPSQHGAGRPKRNGEYPHNGLDRANNDKGYLLENVVPCCTICNNAKSTMAQDEFLGWILKVYKNKYSQKGEEK